MTGVRPDELTDIRQKKNCVMSSSEAVNELLEVAAKVLSQFLRLLACISRCE